MITRTLKDGTVVSTLGFGTMRLPVDENKQIIQPRVQEMVDAAIAGGINYFDTAYPYHDGKSEEAIGQALKKHPRQDFMLVDKLPIWEIEKPEDMERIFNLQLQRAGVDYFDVYLLHALDAERWQKIKDLSIYEFAAQKKAEGKIKRLGFSFHDSHEVLQEIASAHPWDVAQIQLNYIDNTLQHADLQYKILTDLGIDIIVMEPIRGGFLADLPEAATKALADVHSDWGNAAWALRWVAAHKNAKVILSGMSTQEQMQQNLATFAKEEPFGEAEYKAIDQALDALNAMGSVPCTGCRYCMDCPFGVDIPRIFAIYNDFKRHNNSFMCKTNYIKDTPAAHRADNCTQCGACVTHCPQHIDIPKQLAQIHGEIMAMD